VCMHCLLSNKCVPKLSLALYSTFSGWARTQVSSFGGLLSSQKHLLRSKIKQLDLAKVEYNLMVYHLVVILPLSSAVGSSLNIALSNSSHMAHATYPTLISKPE
jgi:hypothetical protein